MKKILFGLTLISIFNVSKGQNTALGINTETPLSTVDVHASNSAAPSNTTGVIIPRVTSLNTTNTKVQGLLVFYDVTDDNARGFYYWNGTTWKPFLSISRIGKDTSVTIATLGTSFAEGNIVDGHTAPTDNTRTIKFATVKTNDTSTPSSVDASGNLVINKTGYYYISGNAFLLKTGHPNFRDIFKMTLFVNGVAASVDNAANVDIEGYNSFPIAAPATILISGNGVYKLDAGDVITMKVIRTYVDTSTPSTSNREVVAPDPSSPSRMTLRYMGDW